LQFRQASEILSKASIGLVVCDEGHRLKNSNIKTTQCLQQMSTKRRVILSGTPIQNDLAEFFAMADFVNPGILGDYRQFKRVFEDPIVVSRQKNCVAADVQLGESRSAELARLTGLFVLRRTQDVNQKYLPPKTEMVLFCPPTKLQVELYKAVLQSSVVRYVAARCSNDRCLTYESDRRSLRRPSTSSSSASSRCASCATLRSLYSSLPSPKWPLRPPLRSQPRRTATASSRT